MDDSIISFVNQLSSLIDSVPGLYEFIETNKSAGIQIFRKYIEQNQSTLDYDTIIKIKIIEERYFTEIEKRNPISFINPTKVIDDTIILSEFARDFNKSHTGKHIFKKAEVQHYKTITENIVFHEVDLSDCFVKYKDSYHPYICSKLAISFLNAKKYDIGIPLLKKALMPIFSTDNIYWHNIHAIYGCTEALFEVQHLLGRKYIYGLFEAIGVSFFDYLSILYLYLSRSIYPSIPKEQDSNTITETDLESINFFSIRGDLVYDYSDDFAQIWFGVNPNIQVMADKYMSYHIATQLGLEQIAEQCKKDAYKLYQHNSLVPNGTGGISDIEDETMFELIEKANKRSIYFARETIKLLNNCKWLNSNILSKIIYGINYRIKYG